MSPELALSQQYLGGR